LLSYVLRNAKLGAFTRQKPENMVEIDMLEQTRLYARLQEMQ